MDKTGERIIPDEIKSTQEYLMYLRHLMAYELAKKNLPDQAVVLEVGSGSGYGTYTLSQSDKINRLQAIDIDPEAVEYAQKKYPSDKISFTSYAGQSIPFPDQSFDMVVSFQVIEHVKNDADYLQEIYRLLKPNGLFILSTPNAANRLKKGQKPWNKFHLREYTSQQLQNILKKYFADINIMGLTAIDAIHQLEMARIKKIQKLVTLDPFNIRHKIPKKFNSLMDKLRLLVLKEVPSTENPTANYTLEQFKITDKNIDDCLDLIAIVKKS